MKTKYVKGAILAVATLLAAAGCKKDSYPGTSIAVFIPGIMADSPTYAHVAEGVQEAVDQHNAVVSAPEQQVQLYIMEAGTNQAEWSSKLTALAASGSYGLILSSNPSLPEIAAPIAAQFPRQKFIFLDAALDGNRQIYTVSYNQRDQAYISGYMAGLFSTTHKVGLIAAQEYPIMNKILHPYFAKGAEDAAAGTSCDFRIVGNWYDASKGAELADAMHATGVDVILPICGGASQGVISSAREHGMHIVWFDENGFRKAPGTIISCCMTNQHRAAKEAVLEYLAGDTAWGSTKTLGYKDGYVDYFQDDPTYIQYVSEDVRAKMKALTEGIRDGSIELPQSLQ